MELTELKIILKTKQQSLSSLKLAILSVLLLVICLSGINQILAEDNHLEKSHSELYWSIKRLQNILMTLQEYEAYALENYQALSLPSNSEGNSNEYHDQAQSIKKLQIKIDSELAKVTQANRNNFGPRTLSRLEHQERDLSNRVANFKQATNLLINIQQRLRMIKLSASQRRLRELSSELAIDLLRKVDELYSNTLLYSTVKSNSLSVSNFTEALFGIRGEQRLKDYLSSQAERVSYLAIQYAEPLLSFMINMDLSTEENVLFNKWRNTLVAINKKQNRNSENTLDNIEEFLISELSKTDPSNCSIRVNLFQQSEHNDVFSESLNRIIQRAESLCESSNSSRLPC